MMRIIFLGATGTVTGSKYVVAQGDASLLVDCGLFQGYKQLHLRNWGPLPVAPATLSAVSPTHANVDLPALIQQGFRGESYCTKATFELCAARLRSVS